METVVKYKHWRVPALAFGLGIVRKGKPDSALLLDYGRRNKGFTPAPKGGATEARVYVKTEKGLVLKAVGISYCSLSDNFDYRKGRAIALGRAKKQLYSVQKLG